VTYNITDPSASVTTMVPTSAIGVLLAPYNKINSMDSGHFYGEVIDGYNQVITLMSGAPVVPTTPTPPTVTNTATASTTAAGVAISATGSATVMIH
jgi:hypothetical protein